MVVLLLSVCFRILVYTSVLFEIPALFHSAVMALSIRRVYTLLARCLTWKRDTEILRSHMKGFRVLRLIISRPKGRRSIYVEIITLLSVFPVDAGAVWFEHSSYTVHEGAGNVTVSIRAIYTPAEEVSFTTVDGSATGGKQCIMLIIYHNLSISAFMDYIPTNYNNSFEVGVMEFTITVVDDSLDEPEEVFYCSLSLVGQSKIRISQVTAVIHIIDNDG